MDTFIEPIFKRRVKDDSRKIQGCSLKQPEHQTTSLCIICQCNFPSEETSDNTEGHGDTGRFQALECVCKLHTFLYGHYYFSLLK